MQISYDIKKDMYESLGKEHVKAEYILSEDYLSDINNLIEIDERNGVKKINRGMTDFFNFFCTGGGSSYQTGCRSYDRHVEKNSPVTEALDRDEFNRFEEYFHKYEEIFDEILYF